MQHPDEGTIHAWLDGALSAEEARAFEAHVAGCAGCAAAVTEARGLLAASSRILSALDSVPGGVLPAREPEPGKDGRVTPIARSSLWRSPGLRAAAAIVLVGSVSWLATRSSGRPAERPLGTPGEVSTSATYDTMALSSARARADSSAGAAERATASTAPPIAGSAARRGARVSEQGSIGSGATGNADRAVASPAPAPQVVAAPRVLPYAMPKLTESPNAGAIAGAGGTGTVIAQSAAAAAQAPPPAADANTTLREERRVADAGLSARAAAKVAPRMKASARSAASGAPARTDTSPALNAAVQGLAGCYRLEAAGSVSDVTLVPARVELVAELLSLSDTNSWLLRPAPGSPPFATGEKAAWSVLGADLVRLQLGEGAASVDAQLGVRADSLHGRAELRDPRIRGGYMASEMRGSRMPCSTP